MKAIKFFFAIFTVSILLSLTSCSATSMNEDDELYSIEQTTQATGEETAAEIIRSRD
jgi:hypothetical protein